MRTLTADAAMRIAKDFAEQLVGNYGTSVMAVYAIGSLGGGYYRPGQSDIDTLIIVDAKRSDVAEYEDEIARIGAEYQKRYRVPKGFGTVVVGEEQLYPPYLAEEELVLEIVRLKTQARLVYGDYDLHKVPVPDRQAIIDHCNAFEDWRDREGAVAPDSMTRQMSVNSILLLLVRYLMIACGIIEFNKFKVVDAYMASSPPFVNDGVLTLVKEYLVNGDGAIDDNQLLQMSLYHEHLKREMNRLLLNRT